MIRQTRSGPQQWNGTLRRPSQPSGVVLWPPCGMAVRASLPLAAGSSMVHGDIRF
jgi:hypothetical protein